MFLARRAQEIVAPVDKFVRVQLDVAVLTDEAVLLMNSSSIELHKRHVEVNQFLAPDKWYR